jgi:CHAT domain
VLLKIFKDMPILYEQLMLAEIVDLIPQDRRSHGCDLDIEIVDDRRTFDIGGQSLHALHWEVLEQPSLWNPDDIGIRVRRVVLDKKSEKCPISMNASNPVDSFDATCFRVLLVVARDCTNDVASYQDIGPDRISSTLLQIKQELEEKCGRPVLEIQIVRPGTFTALETHLEQTLKTKGPNYFHLVHFDIHGKIASCLGQTSKGAFLRFASRKLTGKLADVSTTKVAKLLHLHQIRFAVLTSCGSARAGLGEDANLAKAFVGEGIAHVLAMLFKVMESAATTFFRSFYDSMLLKGSTFSSAGRQARISLRIKPLRPARFNLQREIQDWIIPVIYSSEEDPQFHLEGNHSFSRPPSDDFKQSCSTANRPLFGRGFDILTFEHTMIEHRTIGLCGPAGVGKTSFINHLLKLWKQTGFLADHVYLHLPRENIRNSETLESRLLEKLDGMMGPDLEKEAARTPVHHSLESCRGSAIRRLRTSRSVIVLDGLEDSYSD